MALEQILKIQATIEGMDEVLAFVSSILDEHGCTDQARTQLRMAMEELYVNVAHYAYSSGEGWVEIRGSVDGDVATFSLIDGGTPFDPLEKPDPDIMLSGEERRIGGLGIYMVKTMVDKLEYEYRDGCNCLTMQKKL